MTNLACFKPLQGDTLRVTRLDECGNPEFGACAFGVSDGFVQATLTPNTEDGERFLQRNAAGRAIVNQRSAPSLNWYDVSLQFQEIDPELFTIITGLQPYEDAAGNVIGFPVTESDFATANFALELWMGNAEEGVPADRRAAALLRLQPASLGDRGRAVRGHHHHERPDHLHGGRPDPQGLAVGSGARTTCSGPPAAPRCRCRPRSRPTRTTSRSGPSSPRRSRSAAARV